MLSMRWFCLVPGCGTGLQIGITAMIRLSIASVICERGYYCNGGLHRESCAVGTYNNLTDRRTIVLVYIVKLAGTGKQANTKIPTQSLPIF